MNQKETITMINSIESIFKVPKELEYLLNEDVKNKIKAGGSLALTTLKAKMRIKYNEEYWHENI